MCSVSKEYPCHDGIHQLLLSDDGQRLYAHLLSRGEMVNECCLLASGKVEPYSRGTAEIAPERLPLSVLWEFDGNCLEYVFIVCRHGGFRLLAPCCAEKPTSECRSYAEICR